MVEKERNFTEDFNGLTPKKKMDRLSALPYLKEPDIKGILPQVHEISETETHPSVRKHAEEIHRLLDIQVHGRKPKPEE